MMKKMRVTLFVVCALVISISIFGVNSSFAEPQIPPQVMVIVVKDIHNKPVGLANAFLVDRARRIFATAAHVVDAGKKFVLPMHDKFYAVHVDARDVNWLSDCAIIKWADKRTPLLPPPVDLGNLPPVLAQLTTRGYRFHVDEILPDSIVWSPYPLAVQSKVMSSQSEFGISLGAQVGVLEVLLTLKQTGMVPHKDAHKLYTRYIWVDSNALSEEFGDGLSGAPTYNDDGQVVGFLSASNGYRALIVPASEIVTLLRKSR